MRHLVIFLVLLMGLSGISVSNAFAEFVTIYEKDRGEGLTSQECEHRRSFVGKYFEPDLHLAKLKAENHPAFKEFVRDDSYSFLSDGGRDLRFSETCDEDLGAFELNYATNITENSFTMMDVHMDFVSYDVNEIIVHPVDHAPYEPHRSQPLMLSVRDWEEIEIVGEFTRSDPPKPPQTFRFPYLVNGGSINGMSGKPGTLTVDLSAKENAAAIFAFKLPRNYPYTDHDDEKAGHPGHGPQIFAISEELGEIAPNVVKSDCFYEVWIPFSGNMTMEFIFQISYLQGWEFRGDYDVPEYCKGYTLATGETKKLSTLSPLQQVRQGTSPYHVVCNPMMILVVNDEEKSACVNKLTARALLDRGWADTSTDIYTEHASDELLTEFQTRLIDENTAIESVKNRIKTTDLEINPDVDQSELKVNAKLAYTMLDKGYFSVLDVDYQTGLPTSIMGPTSESHYRSPDWYSELQKYYLGKPHHRVEDGELYWKVSYRTCPFCIADYPVFFVHPITGEVERTLQLDSLFTPKYD